LAARKVAGRTLLIAAEIEALIASAPAADIRPAAGEAA
jgi:hypothetical protein